MCYKTGNIKIIITILWHIDPMLGNDHETDETTAVARQRTASNSGNTIGSSVFYMVHSEDVSLDRQFSVQLVSAVQLNTVE
jgi:hypothetical protein